MSENKLNDALKQLVANASVHYQKLRGFHWNVRGRGFFHLHGLFEEQYGHWAGAIDEVAERLLTLDVRPPSSLAEMLELASLSEAKPGGSAEEMIRDVRSDLLALRGDVLGALELAEAASDRGTVGLLDGMLGEIEKTLWMLSAWLDESPAIG